LIRRFETQVADLSPVIEFCGMSGGEFGHDCGN
jgi:hypothetical protein